MLNKYSISTSGPQKTTIALKQADLIILTRPTDEEIQQLCQTFNLNKFSFRYRSSPEEVSRFHRTTSDVLDNPFFLVVYDYISSFKHIEKQLAPSLIIFDSDHLIICTDSEDSCKNITNSNYSNLSEILFNYISQCQYKIMDVLVSYKKQIDDLDSAARRGFSNTRLRELTTLTRKLVFLEHTMVDQTSTIEALVKSDFCQNVPQDICQNLTVEQQRLTKTIHIFRDLLDSISSLFTAMMDSNLNNLMKFLDSAGLVIAVAALVTGFMGMNVGGLPWKDDLYGFWITLGIASILSLLIAYLLHRKQYLK
ncbi:magnesium transporter CorA family protein [Limosilactobacillus reuteri]|uniref:magnesium transporter CorA family protein n=1 Tax=Limosilactobacillus reuteri TaxID=1598 RepID=UPI00214BD794|nr:magnesium transporter CorA family protein [Limosilactobacillus reuteri]MCR1877731.1 magnesium transporter CorA family protein [Limosilactobacillus reuteri]